MISIASFLIQRLITTMNKINLPKQLAVSDDTVLTHVMRRQHFMMPDVISSLIFAFRINPKFF